MEWVVSQINGGDGVSMDGGCGERRMRRGKGGRRGDEGWCVPAGCAMEGMSELPLPLSSPSLFSLSADSHAICMGL